MSGLVTQLVAGADDARSAEYRRAHRLWRAQMRILRERNAGTEQRPRDWTKTRPDRERRFRRPSSR